MAWALWAGPIDAGSPSPCVVSDLDTGFTATSLQGAVSAARSGDRLTVQGVCHGSTITRKSLTITGVRTETSGPPTLDGDSGARVVQIGSGRNVTEGTTIAVAIAGLTIQDGRVVLRHGGGTGGAGILNWGTLTLRDVVVRDNVTSESGGGIYTAGMTRVTLMGTTRIKGNRADRGGGVENLGTLVMTDSSRISGNRANYGGGGVANGGGTIVMRGDSQISGNSVPLVAPIGGGIETDGNSSLKGVVCAPKREANVFGNDPDDCRTITLFD